jgi:RNA polymerase sigma-70 factor (ECF subfamily)
VQGAPSVPDVDRTRQRDVVSAFLAASCDANFEAILELLGPDVAPRAEATAVELGAASETRGAQALTEAFQRLTRVA